MEPILAGALGVVIYTGYVTVRDLIADFRAEASLRPSRRDNSLAGSWKNGVMRFLQKGPDSHVPWGSDHALMLVTYRSPNAYSGGRTRRER